MTRLEREQEIIIVARYIIDNKATLRQAAQVFDMSKSTIYIWMSEKLKILNPRLYREIKKVFAENKENGRVKGGFSRRKKKYNLKKGQLYFKDVFALPMFNDTAIGLTKGEVDR